MDRSKVSLKAIDVFLAVCRRGALGSAARDLAISDSTASHHISELERALGVALFDHSKRPIQLTPEGEIFRRRADQAMANLRIGLSEIAAEDLHALARQIRVALIEDFDADVGPSLAQALIEGAPLCEFSFLSRPTHDILDLLLSDQIDIGVATAVDIETTGFTEAPILRDPFVLVMPAAVTTEIPEPVDLMAKANDLPFLRYSNRQLLGRRIEAQLRRMNLHLPRQLEFETTHIILSLVAAGRGWTVTTALSFARAQRYHAKMRVQPFPGAAFAREISLFAREDVPSVVTETGLRVIRQGVARMVIAPMLARYPWLADGFRLLDQH